LLTADVTGNICCLNFIISKGLELIPSSRPVPAAAKSRPGLRGKRGRKEKEDQGERGEGRRRRTRGKEGEEGEGGPGGKREGG
jgi:hypothetical protein